MKLEETENDLKVACKKQLLQAIKLIENIKGQRNFIKESKFVPGSTIGKHFRHILDHFFCLFKAIDKGEVVNYDGRERDVELQSDPIKAKLAFLSMIKKIENLDLKKETKLQVRSLLDESDNKNLLCASSLKRELWFCVHHAIHHHALIKVICQELDIEIDENFGIAPATLRKRSMKEANNSNTERKTNCKKGND